MKIDTYRRELTGNIVEAVRLDENNVQRVAQWCGAFMVEEIDPEHPEEKQPGLNVQTPNGARRASLGMYVVKFSGAFHVAKTRVFEELYELVVPVVVEEVTQTETTTRVRTEMGFSDPFEGLR